MTATDEPTTGEREASRITRWHKDQRVAHKITDRIGHVIGVDFEEDLVEVRYAEWDSWVRMENLQDVLEATS